MTVISAFFGALLSIWIIQAFPTELTQSWGCALGLILGTGMIALLLSITFSTLWHPDANPVRRRILYFSALFMAFALTLICTSVKENNILITEVLRSPKSWVFFIIVFSWISATIIYSNNSAIQNRHIEED